MVYTNYGRSGAIPAPTGSIPVATRTPPSAQNSGSGPEDGPSPEQPTVSEPTRLTGAAASSSHARSAASDALSVT